MEEDEKLEVEEQMERVKRGVKGERGLSKWEAVEENEPEVRTGRRGNRGWF